MTMLLPPADTTFVRDLVRREAAIRLDVDQDQLIENRLALVVRAEASGVAGLVRRAQHGDKQACRQIIEAMATHETSFFRDHVPFEALLNDVLPRTIAAREATRRIVIWSAACATGQEPYSIAMLIRERFPELAAWDVRIFATDLSTQALQRAREGRFRDIEVGRGLSACLQSKYFAHEGTEWRIAPELRAMVQFQELNLIGPWPPPMPRPDIVFLRNVLIYFDVATKKLVLDRVREVIAPDGSLFLGAPETTVNVATGWRCVIVKRASYFVPAEPVPPPHG